MKPWQRALSRARELGPDIPRFDKDIKLVYGYIVDLEEQRSDALQYLEAFVNCTHRNGDTCNELLADAMRTLGAKG